MKINESDLPLSPQQIQFIEILLEYRPYPESAIEGLVDTYMTLVKNFESGGLLYICGNGGSFADAIHIKAELAKSFEYTRPIKDPQIVERLAESTKGKQLLEKLEMGLPVIVLGESHGIRSAYENDQVAEFSYAQELLSFLDTQKQGVLLGISTSGTAKNVIAAATLAQAYGISVIGFTGPRGGPLSQMANVSWKIPGNTTAAVQENQTPLYHTLCRMLENHFFGKRTVL